MDTEALSKKSRMERKKERTTEKIVSVAMNLFKKNGIDVTTMEQIAIEADIAKGTLYNYFPNKEAIISEYMQSSFKSKFSARMVKLHELPDTRTRMVHIFGTLIDGVQDQSELFEKYLVYRMQNMVSFHQEEHVKSGFYLLGEKIIELGQQQKELRDDLPGEVLRDFFEFTFIEVVKIFFIDPERFNAGEAVERCVDLFLNGARKI